MTLPLVSLEQYLRTLVMTVHDLWSQHRGGEVLGAVPGRPEGEDVTIGVDMVCERLLEAWCRENVLDVEIHSEHGTSRPLGGSGPPRYLVASDPFDGSGLFLRGLPAEWWSVLSIYAADGAVPMVGGAIDILRRELYLADHSGVTLVTLETNERVRLHPEHKTSRVLKNPM